MEMVISSLIVFSSSILILTALIIIAEYKLVRRGSVDILVNENYKSPLKTESGGTLLSTLKNHDIFLPSACGGKGTCGTCICKVLDGGGDLLPTEKSYITRRMAKNGLRLACQVKVRENMEIALPKEILSIKKLECEVISNRSVATFIKELILKLPDVERLDFKSGGYIQIEEPKHEIDFSRDIDIPEIYRDDWNRLGLFNLKVKSEEEVVRAYSLANYPAEGDKIMLNVRIATPPWDPVKQKFKDLPPGEVSSYIFSRRAGEKVMISGPYGEFFIQDTDREMMYLGGGAGMAPMRSHLFHLT